VLYYAYGTAGQPVMSLKKDRLSWIFIGVLLVVVSAAAASVVIPQLQTQATLRLGDGVYKLRALNQRVGEKIAYRDVAELPPDKAILHMYDADKFWIMDTKNRTAEFDLIWLNKDRKVVHIVKNASSESQPDTVFSSKVLARYVVELAGGTVDQKTIRIGSTAFFEDLNVEGWKQ
jgi:uncharacterized membrane protein (UPF0127 family)